MKSGQRGSVKVGARRFCTDDQLAAFIATLEQDSR
jgi:hypothetical protein